MYRLRLKWRMLGVAMFKYGNTQSATMPGPEINVGVFPGDGSNQSENIVCVIDTGATVSVLPISLVKSLPLRDYTSARIRWGSGDETPVVKYLVSLRISGKTIDSLWVVMVERPYGLIGRDVLNKHLLTCDGPSAVWAVEPEWL